MKKIIKILSLALVFTLCLTFMGCSGYNKIERAFRNNGYILHQEDDNAEYFADKAAFEVEEAVLYNRDTQTYVLVFKFHKTEQIKYFYQDVPEISSLMPDVDDALSAQGFYNDCVLKGYAKGKCLILTKQGDAEVVKGIVKGI